MNKYKKNIVCIFYTKIKEQIKKQLTLRIDKKCEHLPSNNNQNKKEHTEKSSIPPKKQAAQRTDQKPAPLAAPNNQQKPSTALQRRNQKKIPSTSTSTPKKRDRHFHQAPNKKQATPPPSNQPRC